MKQWNETVTSSKSSWSADTDILIYLREKPENDQRLKEEELESRTQKRELLEAQQKTQINQQKDFINTVWESVRKQQQTQQMMVLMSQMLNTLKKDQKNFVTSQYKKKEKTFVPEFWHFTYKSYIATVGIWPITFLYVFSVYS